VRIDEPVVIGREANVDASISILFVEGESALELNSQESCAVNVLGDKVRSSPIVAQAYRNKAKICKDSLCLLEIVAFLLATI
jgi:hypothetical protein